MKNSLKTRLSKHKVLALFVLIFFIPIKVACGHPMFPCAMPPIPPDTKATYTYQWEPIGFYVLEWIVPFNLPGYWSTRD